MNRLPSGIFSPDILDRGHIVAPMAKVINPLLSIEARGRVAGLVYNTWHGISIVKAHSGPNQPNSAKQLLARARLTTITAQWRDLTQANRDAWSVYADAHPESDWTGNPLRLTGQNWYVRCTLQLLRIGEAAIATPPAVAAPDPVVGWALSMSNGDIQAMWDTPIDGTDKIDVFALGPVSTGVDPKFEHATFLTMASSDTGQPSGIIASAAPGRWRLWVKVIATATGLTSTYVSDIEDVSGV